MIGFKEVPPGSRRRTRGAPGLSGGSKAHRFGGSKAHCCSAYLAWLLWGRVLTQDTQDTQGTQDIPDIPVTQGTQDFPDIPVTQSTQGTQDTQNTQGTRNTWDTQDTRDTRDTQGTWNTWDTQDTQSTQDTRDTRDTRDIPDIPVTQGTRNILDTQGTQTTQDTQGTQSTVPTCPVPPLPPRLSPCHYGKDIYRSGGPDLHNFISSGFVTLGRGHTKDDQEQNYNHLILDSATQTPTHDKPRMNNILTSATEPYDLSFSRSFQNLSHLPPSYESAVKTNPSKYSSLKRLTDKEADEYYMRRRHLPDLAARGTLPINVIKMSQQGNHRDRPRRPIRAMSQDRVLSPERIMPEEFSMSYERILSDEQLLSAERLHSQDPLLSPERSAYPEQSMSRALSHTDVFVSTPVLDRYRMSKMHSHPSASNNLYNTLSMNPTSAKRQAFASRRHNTVEQLHYIPGHHHHYRTASKTEVTV
ncbi:protein shisa-6 [Hirundo rustica]|nr:protein shisa-6 [Hirundo rustica]